MLPRVTANVQPAVRNQHEETEVLQKPAVLGNQGPTDACGVEGTFEDRLVQPMCSGQRHLPPEQVTQSPD